MNKSSNSSDYYTLTQASDALRISAATARNWLKSGKLQAAAFQGTKALFSKDEILKLKNNLTNGTDKALKSRRNKLYQNNHELYAACLRKDSPNLLALQQLLTLLKDKTLSQKQICYYIAEIALRLFFQTQAIPYNQSQSQLKLWFTHLKHYSEFDKLLFDLIKETPLNDNWHEQCPESFVLDFTYEQSEDILGLLYLSLKNRGERKADGAYYTPPALASSLMQNLFSEDNAKQSTEINRPFDCNNRLILDPACGTGGFLLNLPSRIPFSAIYGTDLDLTSVHILRINFFLRQSKLTYKDLCTHFSCKDFLLNPPKRQFHYIIGNPPWGSHYNSDYKKKLRQFVCNQNGKADSFALFLEQSVNLLKDNGALLFLIPETFLHIKSYYDIRKLLLEKGKFSHIHKLEHAFLKVQSPVIALQYQRTYANDKVAPNSQQSAFVSAKDIKITLPNQSFVIRQKRPLTAEFMPLLMTDCEYRRLECLLRAKNCVTLKGQAAFALGIVTGNNALHLKQTPMPKTEPILKGRDITPFQIAPASSFLEFNPQTLQQYAPLSYYHAPEKLIYRFIGNKLTFAYDNRQHLTLNSCNIVIPCIEGLDVKYILAVLNSETAQFIFEQRFHSLKTLRSHLEQIPIPLADKTTQRTLAALADKLALCQDHDAFEKIYDQLNEIVGGLYQT